MSYLSFIIAFIKFLGMDTSKFNFNEGLDIYLDMVVGIEKIFIAVSVLVLAIVLVVLILLGIAGTLPGEASLSCGCIALAWPILELITWLIANGLANSFSTTGVTDPTKFWLLVFLMVIFGWG